MSRREHLLPYRTRRGIGTLAASLVVLALIPVVALPAAWIFARRKIGSAAPRRPMLVRDAAPYDTAEGSVRRGGLAA
jgi:hypothetical protein